MWLSLWVQSVSYTRSVRSTRSFGDGVGTPWRSGLINFVEHAEESGERHSTYPSLRGKGTDQLLMSWGVSVLGYRAFGRLDSVVVDSKISRLIWVENGKAVIMSVDFVV